MFEPKLAFSLLVFVHMRQFYFYFLLFNSRKAIAAIIGDIVVFF